MCAGANLCRKIAVASLFKGEFKMRIGERTANEIATRRCLRAVALSCMFVWVHASHSQNLPAKDVKSQICARISTDRVRFRPGENIRLHVEIWNTSDRDLFVFKNIDNTFSNALAMLHVTMYQGNQVVGPTMGATSDSFSSRRSTYPPLASELPRYWIALPPQHFYGGEIVMEASWFEKLRVPGKYRIKGKYSSRGFLARDINNPLVHYAQELEQLPYEAWVGEVETNSVWIEVTNER
jgi:hypothetical protein